MSVQLIGLKEANAALRKLPEFARDDAQQVMDVTAFRVATDAKAGASAHRKTGLLDRSIKWARRLRSLSAVVGIEPEAFYWKYLEYGTVHQPARPFLRPAADRNKDDHHRRLIQGLERAASRVDREGL